MTAPTHKQLVENALIGLSLAGNILDPTRDAKDSKLFEESFTPFELFSFTSAALVFVLEIQSQHDEIDVQDYLAALRNELNALLPSED